MPLFSLPYLPVLLIIVHMVTIPYYFHWAVILFTMQAYIYIITYIPYLCYSDKPLQTFAFPSKPPGRPLDASPSLQRTTPPLHLPQAVRPQVHVTLTIRMPSLHTCTKLVHQTHYIPQELHTALSHLYAAATATAYSPIADGPSLFFIK